MTNTQLKNVPANSFLRSVRNAFVICVSSVLLFGFSAEAEAASKKSACKNYTKQAYSNCVNAKKTRTHRKAHTVYYRPQPASFIIDSDTNRVLHAENADAQRYPASLTKMMTLYITFDSLKKGKLKLDQTVPVSLHASSQPPTNIALNPGDRLLVKDAILSLVVRSANDAAVALGEAQGSGTEEGFARRMTAQAKALGMKNTVFHNASGLPDPRQRTTARDMAILGLALKRDFPQYYPFFKTESFSYNGVTYTTHNHVMTRYDGVDGIKTGYIRASGFNLVTSARKDNHNLVGVVIGGSSFRARDDKMIALLDQSFARLSTLAYKNNMSAPVMQIARADVAPGPIGSTVDEEDAISTDGQGDVTETDLPAASAQKKPASRVMNDWGIQVGAYSKKSDAVKAATRAMKLAPSTLASSKIAVGSVEKAKFRARLNNLSEADAESACKALKGKSMACIVFKN